MTEAQLSPVAIWKSEKRDMKKLPKFTGSTSPNKSVAITAYIVDINSKIMKAYITGMIEDDSALMRIRSDVSRRNSRTILKTRT
eukprot:CAMPEP_0173112400 /NCGR_PEP_ID=MMETSP1102-20130122/45997_1 /TAXON_ID=49646 /ORGANISM="Geminigera sp., Strain Caron Lab Isolate" /LENGTH=83 /DNA_ID=CAMNT_0014013467 /DNA_START=35 /DNA_END=282 /DNA_ORIENTATION=-